MKIVPLNIAKYFKEVGYNEDAEHWYRIDGGLDTNFIDDPICSAPTFMDIWLWLWSDLMK